MTDGTNGTTEQAKDRFIEALRNCPVVAHAARQAGLPRRTAYNQRKEDPEFREAWDDALQEGMDLAEAEAWRRGVEGVDEPVFHQGEVVGYQRRYSDALLGRLLQAYRPEKFSEKHKVEHSEGDPVSEALKAVDGLTLGPPSERPGAYLPPAEGETEGHVVSEEEPGEAEEKGSDKGPKRGDEEEK